MIGLINPVLIKKYPAVAGYLIKWTINGPKLIDPKMKDLCLEIVVG
jgi:hypothetical protein